MSVAALTTFAQEVEEQDRQTEEDKNNLKRIESLKKKVSSSVRFVRGYGRDACVSGGWRSNGNYQQDRLSR